MRPARASIVCAFAVAPLLALAPANAAGATAKAHRRPPALTRNATPHQRPIDTAEPGAPTRRAAWVARIIIRTPAMTAPRKGRIRAFIATSATGDGGPVDLLVLGARVLANGTTWLRVLLPQRPNGTSGWIDSNLVELTRTPWRIDVSLRARTVSLLRDGRVLDTWSAVIGKPSTPTPPGLYAIYERARQPNPNDVLGTWALLLTAFSPVLHNFDGGPGQVAIHGRGGASLLDPLGSARSHGCIRVDNSAVNLLAAEAAEGTPVQIS
jgi:lipoprotein-anchoring transpeptidase ErfK/SrfK